MANVWSVQELVAGLGALTEEQLIEEIHKLEREINEEVASKKQALSILRGILKSQRQAGYAQKHNAKIKEERQRIRVAASATNSDPLSPNDKDVEVRKRYDSIIAFIRVKGPATVAQVAEATGLNADTISGTLMGNTRDFKFDAKTGRYRLPDQK